MIKKKVKPNEDGVLPRNDKWIEENRERTIDFLRRNETQFGDPEDGEPYLFYKVNDFDVLIAVINPKGSNSARPSFFNMDPIDYEKDFKTNIKNHLTKKRELKQKNKEELPNHE